MKAQLTINDKTIEVELSTEQLQQLGVEEKEEQEVNKYLHFQPKEGEEYWYVTEVYGNISKTKACDSCGRHNVFRTKEAAEYEKLRQDSMNKRWKPQKGEPYWHYSFRYSEACLDVLTNHEIDTHRYFIGNIHKTEEEALLWAQMYGEAWRVLL